MKNETLMNIFNPLYWPCALYPENFKSKSLLFDVHWRCDVDILGCEKDLDIIVESLLQIWVLPQYGQHAHCCCKAKDLKRLYMHTCLPFTTFTMNELAWRHWQDTVLNFISLDAKEMLSWASSWIVRVCVHVCVCVCVCTCVCNMPLLHVGKCTYACPNTYTPVLPGTQLSVKCTDWVCVCGICFLLMLTL